MTNNDHSCRRQFLIQSSAAAFGVAAIHGLSAEGRASAADVADAQLSAPSDVVAQHIPVWDGPLPTTENAALVYWQAIALLPNWTDEQRPFVQGSALYDDWLGEMAEEAFATTETVMQFMRHGASLKQCDWGTNLNDGPVALLPHNSKCRELARLATFRVLFQSRRGKLDEALDDGLAILSLARHMSSDRVLATTLTGYANEALGVTALAEVVPQLNPVQLRSLAKRHAALPARPPIGDCLLSEKRSFLGWFARTAKEGRTNIALYVLEVVAGSGNLRATGGFADEQRRADIPWLRTLRMEARENPELLTRLIEQTASLWDVGAAVASVPADELEKTSAKWLDRLKDAHPASRALLPPVPSCHAATVRVQARHAILQAGIAYCLDGIAGLQAHPEPFTRVPFTLQKLASAFELSSDLGNLSGEPLVVRFGRPMGAN